MGPIRNSVFLFMALGVNGVLNLVQIKLLTNVLTREAVGSYFASSGICLFFGSLYMLGLPMVIARHIPRFDRDGRLDHCKDLLGLSVITFLALAVATQCALWILQTAFQSPVIRILPIAFIAHIGLFLASIYSAYYAAQRRMHVAAIVNVAPTAGQIILLWFLRDRLSVRAAFFALGASALVTALALLMYDRPRLGAIGKVAREVQPYWRYAILITALAPFILYLDRVIIAGVLSLEVMGAYVIARRVENGLNKVLTIPLYSMAPELSARSDDTDGGVELDNLFRQFRRIYLPMGIGLTVLVGLFGRPIIILVSNEDYLQAYPILLALLLAAMVSTIYSPYTLLARSVGRIDLYFLCDVVWLATYVIANVVLIRKIGAVGVALSATIAAIVTLVVVMVYVRPRLRAIRCR